MDAQDATTKSKKAILYCLPEPINNSISQTLRSQGYEVECIDKSHFYRITTQFRKPKDNAYLLITSPATHTYTDATQSMHIRASEHTGAHAIAAARSYRIPTLLTYPKTDDTSIASTMKKSRHDNEEYALRFPYKNQAINAKDLLNAIDNATIKATNFKESIIRPYELVRRKQHPRVATGDHTSQER